MSQTDSGAADTDPADTDPEMAVRNRSQYADTLHRPDPDADEPEPACPVCYDDDADYTLVPVDAYRPHYDLCGYPQCFGGEES